jgi:hypothetical protein
MPTNDQKPSDRITNSGAPLSSQPTYPDGQKVRSPNNSRRVRQDLWPKKPPVPVPIEHL